MDQIYTSVNVNFIYFLVELNDMNKVKFNKKPTEK